MRTALRTLLWLTWLVSALSVTSAWAANPNEFLDFSDPTVPGRLYVPPEAATSTEPRPLILFLHGAGETGSNNGAQVNGNIDNLFDEAKERGAFLYAPQATSFNWTSTARTSTVMNKIDEAIGMYNIDPDRLYVTGLSMGGGGTWNMYNRFDDRFAAAVPIAAVSPATDFDPNNLVGKPSWAFHARNDGTVPSTASRGVVNQVLGAASAGTLTFPATNNPAITVRYTNDAVGMNFTEFSLGGHGIWGPVYDRPDLYEWMFSHELAAPTMVDPTGGAQLIVDNVFDRLPIAGPDAVAIPAGTGFFSVGSISLSDQEISQTNAQNLSTLASSFTPFGASLPVGANGLEGLIYGDIGAPLAADDPRVGENIYLLVGDGDDIESSDSLFVFKSDEVFTTATPSAVTMVTLAASVDTGEILLGERGTVFANRSGGFRDGIIAAALNVVPEPSTLVSMLFGVILASHRRNAIRL